MIGVRLTGWDLTVVAAGLVVATSASAVAYRRGVRAAARVNNTLRALDRANVRRHR